MRRSKSLQHTNMLLIHVGQVHARPLAELLQRLRHAHMHVHMHGQGQGHSQHRPISTCIHAYKHSTETPLHDALQVAGKLSCTYSRVPSYNGAVRRVGGAAGMAARPCGPLYWTCLSQRSTSFPPTAHASICFQHDLLRHHHHHYLLLKRATGAYLP